MNALAEVAPAPAAGRRSSGNKYWIARGLHFSNVQQAGYKITTDPSEVLSTVLGSCVAVCVRDPVSGIGGMNHFLLPTPDSSFDRIESTAMRYGSFAIEVMVNKLIADGAFRGALEVKVFGGANMFDGTSQIGFRNAQFVEEYLEAEGLKVLSADLRGNNARKVRYRPSTGEAWVKKLSRHDDTPFILEQKVEIGRPGCEVELF